MKPAQSHVCKKPPEIIEKMRSRQRRKGVPDGFAGIFGSPACGTITDYFQIPNGLRVDMDFDSRLPAEMFNLLHNAAFCTVAPIQKGGYDGDSQINPARKQ
jgi:hypothetical protein